LSTLDLAVITFNEEKTIKKCLDSVPFAQNKIVIDSHSTDQTCLIAKSNGAKVIERDWPGFPKQKQFALDQCTSEWILVLDADEWLTSEAQKEILNIIQNDLDFSYRIPRQQIFMGKLLTRGKGVDYPLRLIRNKRARYNNREIHEEIIPDNSVHCLKHSMHHQSSITINERLEKMKRDVEMEMPINPSTPVGFHALIIKPTLFFLSSLVRKKTYKDGLPGIIWLGLFVVQYFLIAARHFENQQIKSP